MMLAVDKSNVGSVGALSNRICPPVIVRLDPAPGVNTTLPLNSRVPADTRIVPLLTKFAAETVTLPAIASAVPALVNVVPASVIVSPTVSAEIRPWATIAPVAKSLVTVPLAPWIVIPGPIVSVPAAASPVE